MKQFKYGLRTASIVFLATWEKQIAALKSNLRRFEHVMARFGITSKELGVTAHGLCHQALIEHYIEQTGGVAPLVRGGEADVELDAAARQSTANLAGHHRTRASGAYLGQSTVLHDKGCEAPPAVASDATVSA